MTAPSPIKAGPMQVDFAITVDGNAIDSSWQVQSIETWASVNRIPKARLGLFDGNASDRTFPVSDAAVFVPGAEVDIAIGYDGEKTSVFKGIVVRHGLEISADASPLLGIELADKAVKMTVGRKTAVFRDVTDADLIGKLIGAAGLGKDVGTTTGTLKEVIQYASTDWDMMLTRADANGLLVTVDAGKVTVKEPDTSTEPVLTVAFGESLQTFDAEVDAASQLAADAVKSYAWDYTKQELADSGPGSVSLKEAGNLGAAKLAEVLAAEWSQQSAAAVTKDGLKAWSTAGLLRANLARLCGRVRFQGSELVKLGKTLALAGVGERFNGTVLITSVHHHVSDGVWATTAGFGLDAEAFAAQAEHIATPDAAGLLPPITGLHTGVVKQVHEDPDGNFRVKVTLPLLRADTDGVWARLGGLYASEGLGAVFFPEVGDEVILAFMNDDPRAPVILGSLYSKSRAPAYPPDKENNKKAIVTRSKLEITFDEKDKIIVVKTPGGHSITLDDKDKSIIIKDSNDNSAKLSKDGIDIKSAKDMTLKAEGDISIEAGGKLAMKAGSDATLKATGIELKSDADTKLEAGANLSLKATANASLEGLQTAVKAQTKLSAEGTAAAELTSSGILTVQGTLVKIN